MCQSSGLRGGSSHELVEHTSELTIRLHAPTLRGLVVEATLAFAELVPDALRGEPRDDWREFRMPAPDRAAGLVEWLNEIVYLCEADLWLPTEVSDVSERAGELRVRARGLSLRAPFVLVKAATLHDAAVRRRGEGLEAEITLDI